MWIIADFFYILANNDLPNFSFSDQISFNNSGRSVIAELEKACRKKCQCPLLTFDECQVTQDINRFFWIDLEKS